MSFSLEKKNKNEDHMNANRIKNRKLISLRIHSYRFNKVRKSHSKKDVTAVAGGSN